MPHTTPTCWHNKHGLQLITDPNNPTSLIIQISDTNTSYPIDEMATLIQVIKTIQPPKADA